MAEDKSRFRRFVEYLQAPPERVKANYNQSLGVDPLVYGYNTSSGYFQDKKLQEVGDGTGNSAVVACLNVLSTSFAEPSLKVYKKRIGGNG